MKVHLARAGIRTCAGGATLRHAAEALIEVCFRDSGRRAHGLEVELTDVEQLDFDL